MDPIFARRGLSLDRLRSFLEVANAGAIAAAAPKNPVKQSQLSRQISELEEFFGKALVERRGRGVVLTPSGTELATIVRETFAGLRELTTQSAEEPVGARLGAGDSVISWLVIPRVAAAFGPKELSLELTTLDGADVVAGLLDAELDLGVVRTSELAPGLRSRPLGTVDYALYVPKALAPRRRTSLQDLLASVPMATLAGDYDLRTRLEAALARAGVRAVPSLVCVTFPQLQRAVATGRFAAVLPTLVRGELPASEFVEVDDALFAKLASRMSLAWTPRLERQRPRLGALIAALARALAL